MKFKINVYSLVFLLLLVIIVFATTNNYDKMGHKELEVESIYSDSKLEVSGFQKYSKGTCLFTTEKTCPEGDGWKDWNDLSSHDLRGRTVKFTKSNTNEIGGVDDFDLTQSKVRGGSGHALANTANPDYPKWPDLVVVKVCCFEGD